MREKMLALLKPEIEDDDDDDDADADVMERSTTAIGSKPFHHHGLWLLCSTSRPLSTNHSTVPPPFDPTRPDKIGRAHV